MCSAQVGLRPCSPSACATAAHFRAWATNAHYWHSDVAQLAKSGASPRVDFSLHGPYGERVAKHLVLKGWATWEEKQTRGARREEDAVPFMARLHQALPH